jgi:hypothetical protein
MLALEQGLFRPECRLSLLNGSPFQNFRAFAKNSENFLPNGMLLFLHGEESRVAPECAPFPGIDVLALFFAARRICGSSAIELE